MTFPDWCLEPEDYYGDEDEPAEVNPWEDLEYESYRENQLRKNR